MSEVSREAEETVAAAIQAWVEYSLPRGLAYAKSLLSDGHVAEDVVHDCFCRLLAKRDVCDLPKDGFKLLLRSITNACVDRGRKSMPVSNSLDLSENPIRNREVPDDRVLQPPRKAMYRELEEPGVSHHPPTLVRRKDQTSLASMRSRVNPMVGELTIQ